MTVIPKNRRVAFVVIPAALIAATAFGVIVGKFARASSLQATPYTQCPYLPYVGGSSFMVSIQNTLYNASSQVQYAQVFDPSGNSLGYWWVNNQATSQATINGTAYYVITTVFNSELQKSPPGSLGDKPSAKTKVQIPPVVTTGSTLCIKTNVGGDGCPTSPPITVVVTGVTPCP